MKTSKLIMSILITLFVINYTIDDWREGGNWFSVSVLIVAVSLIVWIWMKENTSVAFYFAWVFTNIAGVIVGLVIGGFISLISMDLKSQSSQVIGVIIAIVVFSAIFGVVQWLVLRKRFENAKQWILLTMLGSIIGATLIFFYRNLQPLSQYDLRFLCSAASSGFHLDWRNGFILNDRSNKQAGGYLLVLLV